MVTMIVMLFAAQMSSQGYARPELLVDAEWLARNLEKADIRIVDMRRGF